MTKKKGVFKKRNQLKLKNTQQKKTNNKKKEITNLEKYQNDFAFYLFHFLFID